MIRGYSLSEAAQLLGVSVGRIRQLKTAGLLTPLPISGSKLYLIDPASLRRYQQRQSQAVIRTGKPGRPAFQYKSVLSSVLEKILIFSTL